MGPKPLRVRPHKIQSAELGKRSEIGVAGDEGHVVIDTRLGDQRIGELGLAAFGEETGAQCPGTVPEFLGRFEDGNFSEETAKRGGELGVAQDLTENDRRQDQGLEMQGEFYRLDIIAHFA